MALNENRLDVAERILKPHLKEDPFDAAAIRMLAELAARIGRWKDAENLLRRAIELAPGWVAPKANLALMLGRMGRPATSIQVWPGVPRWKRHSSTSTPCSTWTSSDVYSTRVKSSASSGTGARPASVPGAVPGLVWR